MNNQRPSRDRLGRPFSPCPPHRVDRCKLGQPVRGQVGAWQGAAGRFRPPHQPDLFSLSPSLFKITRASLATRLRAAEAGKADAQARADGLAARVEALEEEAAGLRG